MAKPTKPVQQEDDSKMSPELIKKIKQERADEEMMRKSDEAYGKALWSTGMKNGGLVVSRTPKAKSYKCGGKVS